MNEYQLSPADSNLLVYIKNHQDAIFSGVLSTIALDRLKYNVTDKTQFKISEDFSKITITELEEESPVKASNAQKSKTNAKS